MNTNIPNLLGGPLGDWYEQYHRLVHHHIKERLSGCSKEEIEDRTSEVFRRAARRLKNGGATVENPKKWLIRIADSVCADYGREHTGKLEVISTQYTTPEGEERSYLDDLECTDDDLPEIAAEKRALLEEAMRYLGELPPDQQEAIKLRYLKEWDLERIARAMGKSRSTVQNGIRKGLGQLRVHLLQEDL